MIFLLNEVMPQGQAYINIKEPVKTTKIVFIILAITLHPFCQLHTQSIFIYKDSLAINHNIFSKISLNFSHGIANKLFWNCNTFLLLQKMLLLNEVICSKNDFSIVRFVTLCVSVINLNTVPTVSKILLKLYHRHGQCNKFCICTREKIATFLLLPIRNSIQMHLNN